MKYHLNVDIDGCTRTFTQPDYLSKHQKNVHFAVGDDGQLIAKKVRDVKNHLNVILMGVLMHRLLSNLKDT